MVDPPNKEEWKRSGFGKDSALSWSHVEAAQGEGAISFPFLKDLSAMEGGIWGPSHTYRSLFHLAYFVGVKNSGFAPASSMDFTPEEATRWRHATGRSPYKAFDWARWNFCPQEAASWIRSSIKRGHIAFLYRELGVNRNDFRNWCRVAWSSQGGHYELLKIIDLWSSIAGSSNEGLRLAEAQSAGRSMKSEMSPLEIADKYLKDSYSRIFGSSSTDWQSCFGFQLYLAEKVSNMGGEIPHVHKWKQSGRTLGDMAATLESYQNAGVPIEWAILQELG